MKIHAVTAAQRMPQRHYGSRKGGSLHIGKVSTLDMSRKISEIFVTAITKSVFLEACLL